MARKRRGLGLRCPTCKKPVANTAAEFPFCGERCRTVDLGKWASGAYVVSSPVHDPDQADKPVQIDPNEAAPRDGRSGAADKRRA
jgi:endogenous inhibitor of DNA gyrase (YacG/DUF329 family)